MPQNIHFLIIFLLFCPFPFKTLQVCDSKSVFCQRIASLSRYSHMSRVTAKSPPFKPPLPQSSIRRTNAKAGSQRTLDTAAPVDLNSQIDTLHRLNQEELMREVNECLKSLQEYRGSLLKRKEDVSMKEQLRGTESKLAQKSKEILELQAEIGRLKEVYMHPKGRSLANQYSQQHLKSFTLTQQLQKLRKHLQLHIDHHRNLKQKAKDLHNSIKTILPQYYEREVARGFKPLSYGQFRQRALASKAEQQRKERLRSISNRSSSFRSRSVSVRDIVQGSTLAPPPQNNMWQMQRRRSIIARARATSKKKFDYQAKTAQDQLEFLRKEDEELTNKLQQLLAEKQLLEGKVKLAELSFTFSNGEKSRERTLTLNSRPKTQQYLP